MIARTLRRKPEQRPTTDSSPFARLAQPALALLGLAVALLGERLVENARANGDAAPPLLSWALFALGGILLVAAVWPVQRVAPAAAPYFIKAVRGMRRPWLFLGPLALAVACALLSIPRFITLNSDDFNPDDWMANTGSWLLWIAAVVLFGVAWIVWERSAPAPPASDLPSPVRLLPWRYDLLVGGGLFIAALLLRVVNLNDVPPGFWFDEAQNGVVARGLLDAGAVHPVFIADATQMGALYFYFLGMLVKLLGAAIWVTRLLPAIGGSLTIPMIYLLGSRLFGWRVGVAAGALLAFSSWSITFSRFGMVSMSTVALDVGVYLCLAMGIRTGRLGYFAGAGTLLGFALQGYYIGRIVPVVLVAVIAHLIITEPKRLWSLLRPAAPVFVGAVLIAGLPMALFAVQRPDIMNARLNTASIFSPEGSDNNPDALQISLTRHLLMFNWQGDNNPRHNLPGQPLLDWLTAALFFAGAASCVVRIWRWQYFFPLVWFAGALSGGVLSLLFEAPQAHRTLEASVVISLIGGIFLGQVWDKLSAFALLRRAPASAEAATPAPAAALQPVASAAQPAAPPAVRTTLLMRVRRPDPETTPPPAPAVEPTPAPEVAVLTPVAMSGLKVVPIVMAVAFIALIGLIGSITLPRYFSIQANDRRVWEEMNQPQGHTADIIARYGQTSDIYPAQFYVGLNTSEFLAPGNSTPEFHGMFELPFDSHGRDAIILMDSTISGDLARIAQLYPDATFEPMIAPGDQGKDPLMWTIYIPASDLAAINGVRVDTADKKGQLLPSMDLKTASGNGSSVRLQTTVRVTDSGFYSFSWQGANPGSAQITVDNYKLASGDPIMLGMGLHDVVVTATNAIVGGDNADQLLWSQQGNSLAGLPPSRLFDPQRVSPRGLTGAYRQGDDFSSDPAFERVDPVLSWYFHHAPLGHPYTVEWTGALYVPETGNYGITLDNQETGSLAIDSMEVLPNAPGEHSATLQLAKGLHQIDVKFHSAPAAHVYLYWTPPGHARSIIPSAFLLPQLGSYPDPADGSGWPTLDQADGTLPPADHIVGASLLPPPVPEQPTPAATIAPVQGDSNADSAPEVKPEMLLEAKIPSLPDGSGADPRDVTADDQGNFYVANAVENTVRKFDPTGKPLLAWGNTGGATVFKELFGVAIGPGGLIYTLDSGSGQIARYNSAGELQGTPYETNAYSPRGFSVTPGGEIFIADTGGAAIIHLGSDGNKVGGFGERGSDPGQVNEPSDIVVAANGDLLVYDSDNQRIQRLSPNGGPIRQWRIDQPPSPRDGGHIALDSQGRLFITNPQAGRIVIYAADGTAVGQWRDGGLAPAGIFVDAQDNVYVTYPQAGVVRKYRIPK